MGALDDLIAGESAAGDSVKSQAAAPRAPSSALDSLIADHEQSNGGGYSPVEMAKTVGRGALGAVGTVARTVDRFTGAPMRASISAAQNADYPSDIIPDAVKAGLHQFGADPDQAPSGEDIVKRAGVPDGMASKVAGFGMDMAANPLNFAGGAISKAGQLAEHAAPYVRSGVAKVSEALSGVPSEAVEKLIQRPSQVMAAENEGNALNVARNARDEFMARNDAESKAIQGARKQFRDEFGAAKPDNAPIQQSISDFETHNAPNAQGYGPVPENEFKQLGGIKESLDSANAGDLQKLADHLATQVKNFEQARAPGSGDTRAQAYLRSLYGQVKEKLHTMDPEGLGAADARYSEFADKAGRLGKLENEDQMEGFINNYYGKNKTLMRESAQDVIPKSVEDIADIGASRAFTRQGPAGSEMGARRVLGSGLGAVLGGHGLMTGNPGEMLAGGAASLLTSPQFHKSVIGNSSKAIEAIQSAPWFQAIQKNPQLLGSIANPELRGVIGKMLNESQNVPAFAKEKEEDRNPSSQAPQKQFIPEDDAQKRFLEGN